MDCGARAHVHEIDHRSGGHDKVRISADDLGQDFGHEVARSTRYGPFDRVHGIEDRTRCPTRNGM